MSPTPVVRPSLASVAARCPATSGAAADVPPPRNQPPTDSEYAPKPAFGSAIAATSGTRRRVPVTFRPLCHDGRGSVADSPPPLAYPLNVPVRGSLHAVSFHAPSVPVSLVPPTATTYGDEAG